MRAALLMAMCKLGLGKRQKSGAAINVVGQSCSCPSKILRVSPGQNIAQLFKFTSYNL
jgi:hypothetical protein